MSATLVIGLGNRDRGDDGVGPLVVDALQADDLGARLVAWGGAEIDLIELWGPDDEVVVVDASCGGDPPGTIGRLGLDDLLAGTAPPLRATHALGLVGVVQLADRLGRLPARLSTMTIEVGTTALGAPMSAAVRSSVARVVEEVRQLAVDDRHPTTWAPRGTDVVRAAGT